VKSVPKTQGRNRNQSSPKFSFRRWSVIAFGIAVVICVAVSLPRSKPPKKAGANAAAASPTPLDRKPIPHFKPQLPEVKPANLKELLALSDEELERCDIGRMNLLCAEGLRGSENLDVEHCLKTIDAWAAHVDSETKRNFRHFVAHPKEFRNSLPYFQMGMLGTVLAQDLRIQYNPARERRYDDNKSRTVEEWNEFFSSSADVFIHGLLTGKHFGTCSSMPFLYAAIGRRLGYPVTIAARKFHLYARYETGDGTHLNIEATENLGFSTPTDAEYRNGPFPMTQEEIDGMGWLRPLNNKEILSICLSIRAASFRSMKRYDEELETWKAAARYGPGTVFKRKVNRLNLELSQNLKAGDRWDELADEVRGLLLPTRGPMSEHFRNRQLQVELFMNQSTNLAEIEQTVAALKQDLRRYQNEISDTDVGGSFVALRPAANDESFLALLENIPRPLLIARERVPQEYWDSIPPQLQLRLSGVRDEDEIVKEMWAFQREQAVRQESEQRREREAAREQAMRALRMNGVSPPRRDYQPQPLPGEATALNKRESKLPEMYWEWISPEAERRLSAGDIWMLQQHAKNHEVLRSDKAMPGEMPGTVAPTLSHFRVVPSSLLPRGASAPDFAPTPRLTSQPQPPMTPTAADTEKP
jgi:hypothetical protein